MIWPFVEGYWAWAAAEAKDVQTFGRELDALVALSRKNQTFMELYRPEEGAPDGSPRQLWSASGFLSMIYHGLFGMEFQPNGVRFAPVVPERFHELTLDGVQYRGARLRVVVKGSGTRISAFKLDGHKRAKPFIEASAMGAHEIEILLK
jgi:hypothetical protein